jgi:hypothetical protein
MSKNAYLVYGQDGLRGYDKNDVLRIFLSALDTVLTFYDSAGVPRCEIGNLPPRGVSLAHWGFRVSDASGAPLYDSQGVIAVGQILGFFSQSTPTSGTGTSSMQTQTAANVTFTLPRQGTVLVLVTVSTLGTAGNSVAVQIAMDSVYDNTKSMVTAGGATTFIGSTLFGTYTLATGTHTATFGVSLLTGQAWTWTQAMVQVIQLGS